MDENSKCKETPPSPADSGSSSQAALLNVRIKQEPGTEGYETSPAPTTPLGTPQPFLGGHFRPRSYTRIPSSPDTVVCEVCQCEFPNYESLQLHKMAHFNTSHVCYVCDCYFWNSDTLNLHMATIHRELNIANLNHKGELFVCSICLQRFSSNKNLVKHQTQHAKNDENFFGCRVCGLDFIGYRALLAHLNSPRHKEMKVKIQSIFVCVDCRSIFASRDSYAMHMMVRAQNESCDSITSSSLQMSMEAMAKSELQLQAAEDAKMQATNGVPIQGQNGDVSDAVSPLNLSTSRMDRECITNAFLIRQPEAAPPGFKCNLCSTYHPTQDALAMHAMSHACNDLRKDKNLLKGLLSRQHQCGKCLAVFTSPDSLAMHAMMHAKDEAERDATRPMHYLSSLPSLKSAPVEVRPSSAPLPAQQLGMKRPETRCSMCDIGFDSRDEYAMHFIDKHVQSAKSDLKPTINGTDTGGEGDADGGMKRCHSVDDASEQGLKKIRKLNDKTVGDDDRIDCTGCLKMLSKSEMIEHRLDCKPSTKCLTCDMVFLEQEGLSRHMKDQHGEEIETGEKIKCHICGFVAGHEEQYMTHMYMHSPGVGETRLGVGETRLGVGEARPASVLNASVSDSSVKSALERPLSAGDTPPYPAGESQPVVESSVQARRSRRKPRAAARVLPNNLSPEPSDAAWMDGQIDVIGSTVRQYMSPGMLRPMHAPCSPRTLRESVPSSTRQSLPGDSPGQSSPSSPRPSTTAPPHPPQAPDEMKDADIVDYVLSSVESLSMCKFCKIIYTDQTMYYLHMGLHNLNNPWQCNLCGKACRNVHEFSSHVIHY